MAGSSTATERIPFLFVEGYWAWHQIHNGIRYIPVASRLRISLSSVEGVLASILVELYSMADSSTATKRIPFLFVGGYWA